MTVMKAFSFELSRSIWWKQSSANSWAVVCCACSASRAVVRVSGVFIASIIIVGGKFMQPAFIPARNNAYWVFLSLLSLVVMVLGGLATAKYGAGVASDSTKYLSVAQNLLNGNGLFDHRGSPLLSWPPLYPMIIAGVSGLTRLDVFVAAWY